MAESDWNGASMRFVRECSNSSRYTYNDSAESN